MRSPLELLGGAVRMVLGVSEQAEADVVKRSPLALEAKLDEAVSAIHRSAEQLERHVEALGTLADALPALTQSVTTLSEQLGHMLKVTAPVAAVERDASRLEQLFRRRRQAGQPAQPAPAAEDEAETPPPVE